MNTMNNLSVNELLSNIQELRFALTDALITLQRVYEYSVMSKGDVIRVEDSLLLAEQALAGTDNIWFINHKRNLTTFEQFVEYLVIIKLIGGLFAFVLIMFNLLK